jgi:hypothetical protein
MSIRDRALSMSKIASSSGFLLSMKLLAINTAEDV